ncbi:MAG: metal-dependent hydrolase [Vicinamibacterales bacterium]
MFVGHLAVALGARRAAPGVPLAPLVAGSYGLDLLWPMLLLSGVEQVRIEPGATAFTPLAFEHYPWSHSLLMAVVWAVAAGLLAGRWFRSRTAGMAIAVMVVSHWFLDWLMHRPDLPLWPGSPLFGLGLWNSLPATFVVEGVLFVAAIEAYRRAVPARDRIGRWAFAGLIAFTTVIWVTQPWSPPPPNVTSIAVVGLALWLLPLWAAWIERHRSRGH